MVMAIVVGGVLVLALVLAFFIPEYGAGLV